MKNKLLTFSIIAVTVFAGIYSFNNLKEQPHKSIGTSIHLPDDPATKADTLAFLQAELSTEHDSETRLWIKVAFSGVFCLAALYVILSKQYEGENNEVRKWAFGVLTLIAGIWIGTAT